MTRTRNTLRIGIPRVLLATALVAVAVVVHAQTCDPRSPPSQFAREDLRRAASEGDFATAQDYADRARRELEQSAGIAMRCGCEPAQARFDAAAKQIRHARDAETRRELRDIVSQTIPALDEAIAELRSCAKR